MKKTLGTIALGTLLLTSGAHALTQKVELNLNAAVLRGHDGVPLKKMMARQLGRHNTRGWTLTKAEVKAKSKQGLGEISLQVGHNDSLIKTVPGNPESFDSDYSGYSTITLNAPYSYRGSENRGPIRLNTMGMIKIDEVELTLKKQLNYDYSNTSGLLFSNQGEMKAGKVLGSSKTFHLNSRLAGIKLVGTKKKVSITEVKITFMDGQVIIIDELDGKLKEGRMKEFALRGPLMKPVRKVKVTAATMKLFGSRGKLAVHLAK